MSGTRDMFNILNAQKDDLGYLNARITPQRRAPVLTHWQICLRFKHFLHLEWIAATPHSCALTE